MLKIVSPRRLLLVLLVAGLVVAAAWPTGAVGEATAAPEPRSGIHKLVIPAAAFIPGYPNLEYVHGGEYLSALSTFATFIAPIQFPYPEVTIKAITLHVYDNGSQDFALHLGRTRPASGSGAILAILKSAGQSATDPRAFTTTAISPRLIDSAYHGSYLALFPPPGTAYKFYGVTIRYEA